MFVGRDLITNCSGSCSEFYFLFATILLRHNLRLSFASARNLSTNLLHEYVVSPHQILVYSSSTPIFLLVLCKYSYDTSHSSLDRRIIEQSSPNPTPHFVKQMIGSSTDHTVHRPIFLCQSSHLRSHQPISYPSMKL